MIKKVGLLALFLTVCLHLKAQTDESTALGTWNIVNVKLNFDDHWSAFGEAQLRSWRFYDEFFYHELKGGISYRVNKTFGVLVGGGKYETYQLGGDFVTPRTNNETRTWIQFTLNQTIDPVKLEHRYRAEQRWTSSGFRQRYRYRVNPVLPLWRRASGGDRLFLSVFDEVFFTNKAPYFERNRFFAGLGSAVTPHLTAIAGWIYQYDYRLTNPTGHHYAQFSLLFDFGWHRVRAVPTPEAD
jgi:hypothetical protein